MSIYQNLFYIFVMRILWIFLGYICFLVDSEDDVLICNGDSHVHQEFIREIREEFLKSQKPADQIILDETDLCNMLHISKRHAADLRKEGKLKFAIDGGMIYYKQSWVIDYIDQHTIRPPNSRF